MTSVADFIRLSKKDFHNNLDLGMRYLSYVAWAGFYVPDFPEDGSMVKRHIRSQVHEYTRLRTSTDDDVLKLLSLSLTESAADNITEIEGTVNFSLLKACDTPENFVSIIQKASKKYSDKINLKPVLALNTEELDSTAVSLASSLLGSESFSGVYLYGPALLAMPQKFVSFVNSAKQHGLTAKISASTAKSSDDYMKLLRSFVPDVLIHGESAAKDKEILSFMKKNEISSIVTPVLDTEAEEYTIELKAQYLRNLLEAGIKTKAGSESILLFNRSISQFASELCNTGLFTKEEIISVIS